MIRFVAGDLLQTDQPYIAQGVAEGNQEGLGTGLALKISNRWPMVQAAFKRYVRIHGFQGGDIWVSPLTEQHPGIIYLATQPDMYHARLSYVRKACSRLSKWAAIWKPTGIALPKIASGLGKLDWEKDIKPLLIQYLEAQDTLFVVYEDFRLTDEK